MDISTYDKYREQIMDGDVIMFSANEFVSDIIRIATDSPYSHCGIALWMNMPASDIKRLVVIESTTLSNTKDIEGNLSKGVQICILAQRLEGFNGKAWFLPLSKMLTKSESEQMCNWLFQRWTAKSPYDYRQAIESSFRPTNWWFLPKFIRNWLSKRSAAKVDFRALFCSELVTKALQVAGRLPETIDASEILPRDVANFGCFTGKVNLYA